MKKIAAKLIELRKRSFFISTHQTAVADHIGAIAESW
jgi:hypothetical protein